MKETAAHIFEKIENLIRNSKLQMAKNELSLFSKSKNLRPLERIELAMFHMRLGQSYKAIRCINKELAPTEFDSASIEELCEQATLAHILNQIGAQNYAQRLLAMINEVTDKREIILSSVLPELDRYMGNIYYGAYNYQKALPFFQRVLEHTTDPDSYLYKLAKIGVADALEGMGNSKEAISIVSEILSITGDDQNLLRAICYQARGEYLFRRGRGKDTINARIDFDQAAILFDEKTDTKDFAFLNKWSGVLRMCEGNKTLAHEELERSLQILQASKNRPTTYFEVFYWLEQLPEHTPKTDDMVALRAHPLPSPFGVLAGKIDRRIDNIQHPWIVKLLKQNKGPSQDNCWLLMDSKLEDRNYGDLYRNEIITQNMAIVDLNACLTRNTEGEYKTISENQSKALLAIIGSGSLGISQWSLIDSIYGQNFYDPISGIERINKTIEQLRRNGYDIYRKNNHYFFKISNGMNIIIPTDITTKGPYTHFAIDRPTFKRKEIEEVYCIKKATANIWVKDWELDGIIEKFGVGKSSYYKFI
ncbi:MAG: tetratricopeptide repeat protein [Bacteriovoracaceae bacterium]|nr:tetratricopeptide repeat protein [Bacteriovoracaceae bacterium]